MNFVGCYISLKVETDLAWIILFKFFAPQKHNGGVYRPKTNIFQLSNTCSLLKNINSNDQAKGGQRHAARKYTLHMQENPLKSNNTIQPL